MNKFHKEKYIEQRKTADGWSFCVRKDGKRLATFNENRYGDPKLAYNKAIQYRNKIMDVSFVENPNSIFLYDVFMEMEEFETFRLKTKKNHESMYKRYIKDNIPISQFNRIYVQSKLNSLVEDQSDDIINRVYSLLCRIDEYCLMKEYYIKPVMVGIKKPVSHKIPPKNDKELADKQTIEEIKKLLKTKIKDQFEKEQFPLILDFLYLTGCRPCEVWALNKNDCKNGYINIYKEVGSTRDNYLDIRTCKNKTSVRKFPINKELDAVIKKATKLSPNELLFPTRDGGLYRTDDFGQRIHLIAKRNGIDFNFYMLRHRFSTDMFLNGVDPRTIMELMGHTSSSMSLEYARSNDSAKKDALKTRN